jgi:transcriptional regulator with XRE-family HTH domain
MFDNIANLVRTKRLEKKMTQLQLSELCGYKNGQFISNVERGNCSYPYKKINKLCSFLDVPKEVMKAAMMADYESRINGVIYE